MSDQRDLDLVVVGGALVALVADAPLEEAKTFRRAQRGSAISTAIAAAKRRCAVALVTRLGEDPLSRWLVAEWEAVGLHLDFAREVAGRTGLALVGGPGEGRIDGGDVITFRDGSAAAGLEPADLDQVPWSRVKLVYATGSTQAISPSARTTVRAAFERGRAEGARAVYDPTLHEGLWPGPASTLARAAFLEVLPALDVLLLDAPLATGRLLGHAHAADAARAARERGVPGAFVRDGTRGLVAAEQAEVRRFPGRLPDGPILAGELLAALARGCSILAAAEEVMGGHAS